MVAVAVKVVVGVALEEALVVLAEEAVVVVEMARVVRETVAEAEETVAVVVVKAPGISRAVEVMVVAAGAAAVTAAEAVMGEVRAA